LDSAGVATLSMTSLPTGNDSITAEYSGDATNGGSTSAPAAVAVGGGSFAKYVVTLLGGNNATAGSPFLCTVQAADLFGNPVTSYTDAAAVALSVSDPQSVLPGTVNLSSSGFGFFMANLKTAGN